MFFQNLLVAGSVGPGQLPLLDGDVSKLLFGGFQLEGVAFFGEVRTHDGFAEEAGCVVDVDLSCIVDDSQLDRSLGRGDLRRSFGGWLDLDCHPTALIRMLDKEIFAVDCLKAVSTERIDLLLAKFQVRSVFVFGGRQSHKAKAGGLLRLVAGDVDKQFDGPRQFLVRVEIELDCAADLGRISRIQILSLGGGLRRLERLTRTKAGATWSADARPASTTSQQSHQHFAAHFLDGDDPPVNRLLSDPCRERKRACSRARFH